jgi:hypothetical protein
MRSKKKKICSSSTAATTPSVGIAAAIFPLCFRMGGHLPKRGVRRNRYIIGLAVSKSREHCSHRPLGRALLGDPFQFPIL